MSIRAARCYDLESRAIVFANGQPCVVENMKAAGFGHYAELLFELCHNLASYRTDNAEYALFTAICIFSGRLPIHLLIEHHVCNFIIHLHSHIDGFL